MFSFQDRLQLFLIQIVPFIMAVVFHEFAHGWMANRWGDPTAKASGRLTLNPLPHLDILGTLIFPAINMISGINLLIGWAKPVPINPNRFTQYRKGLFWVSLAGPGMNFLLAIASTFIFCILHAWVPRNFYLHEPFINMAYVSISLNYFLGVFNLVPLPPLDGSKVVESFLSYEATRKYEALAQYSFYILMALLLTGALSVLSVPVRFLTDFSIRWIGALF